MKHAVVTGGAGFLGSHLCERLLDDGYGVTCARQLLHRHADNVEHLLGARRVPAGPRRRHRVHARSVGRRRGAALRQPRLPDRLPQLPIATLKVGSIGTLHALGLAKEKGARFLLASTSEAYGDPQVHPQPENYWGNVNPVGPRGVYDEAKRFAEAMTMAYRRTHGVDTGIVRIFNTYGTRMRPNDGRAIPAFATQALAASR